MAGSQFNVLLAGTLEKRSRWKKEWNYRFCVARPGGIDYFISAPALMDEEHEEVPRGSIAFMGDVSAIEEPGRPFCITVNGELLSCANRAEQLKWLTTIRDAVARLSGDLEYLYSASPSGHSYAGLPRPRTSSCTVVGGRSAPSICGATALTQALEQHVVQQQRQQQEQRRQLQPPPPQAALSAQALQEPQLVLLAPEEQQPRSVRWREVVTVALPSDESSATVLFLDASRKSSGSAAVAMCPLTLFTENKEDQRLHFPLLTLSGDSTGLSLQVQVCGTAADQAASKRLRSLAGLVGAVDWLAACLVAALALLYAGSVEACGALLVFVLVLLRLVPSTRDTSASAKGRGAAGRRTRKIALESLTAGVATSIPAPISPTGPQQSIPRWVGRWKLDKSRSELYEPILKDMGVNFVLRKAADAKTSILTISTSETHMTIHLKTWVVVQDMFPLDGSWATKAVPPGSRMKGIARVRLSKRTDTEVEMLTEFPDGWGILRDTLTVAEDGQSFSRRVARSDDLAITRYFTREVDEA